MNNTAKKNIVKEKKCHLCCFKIRRMINGIFNVGSTPFTYVGPMTAVNQFPMLARCLQ